MNAEIIAVGTELLLGQIVNTNAAFLSKQFSGMGIDVYYHTVVGDNGGRLEKAIEIAENRSDIVILTGGLGPTKDDLTKEIVASHLGKELIIDEKTMTKIEQEYIYREQKMTENNKEQAKVIEGSQVLDNSNGMACGMFIEYNKTFYILLPGPPRELEPMFKQELTPLLLEQIEGKSSLHSRVLRFFGIGESKLVTILEDVIDTQTNPTIAPYAGPNEVTLRLTAKGETEAECKKRLDEIEAIVQDRVGDYFYGYGDDSSLAEVVRDSLIDKKLTLSVVEEYTGGVFQQTLTSVSGVSSCFEGGLVVSSRDMLETVLGESEAFHKKHESSSEECAIDMAKRTQQLFQTDIGISFLKEPTEENGQVDKIWIGLKIPDKKAYALAFTFARGRNSNRLRAIMMGLDLIRRELLDKPFLT